MLGPWNSDSELSLYSRLLVPLLDDELAGGGNDKVHGMEC